MPATAAHDVHVAGFNVHLVEAGAGHPVVLLHGSGPGATGSTNFAENIGPLAEHFRVIAVDMPGWGDSDSQTNATGRDHVGVLVGLLDELGIERAALVGNSMGGMTALETAVRHADRVSHLVTMGVPAPLPLLFSPGGGPTEGMKTLLQTYRDPSPEQMRRLVEVMVFDRSFATPELAAARSEATLKRPDHIDGWNEQFSGPPAPPPYFALGGRIAQISAPTLVIHGRDDRVVPMENGLHLVAAIRDSRLVVVNRCGHWVQIEHAAEFNRLVTGFLQA